MLLIDQLDLCRFLCLKRGRVPHFMQSMPLAVCLSYLFLDLLRFLNITAGAQKFHHPCLPGLPSHSLRPTPLIGTPTASPSRPLPVLVTSLQFLWREATGSGQKERVVVAVPPASSHTSPLTIRLKTVACKEGKEERAGGVTGGGRGGKHLWGGGNGREGREMFMGRGGGGGEGRGRGRGGEGSVTGVGRGRWREGRGALEGRGGKC